MNYCFDTSALNRLHDDLDKEAIVIDLVSTDQTLITAVNVREVVATEDASRRTSLLRLQYRLTNGFRPLRTPLELLREVTIARIQNRGSVTLSIEESSAGLWAALETPEDLTAELQQESYQWKRDLEDQFTETHRRMRRNVPKIFSPRDIPKSFAHLLRLFRDNPSLFLPTVSAVYERITGAILDKRCLFDVFSDLPEWPLYMAGWAQGMYTRALQDQDFGPRKNAGTVDLWFAVYLAHCDFLVTDDRAQYKALRVINRIGRRRRPRANVLLYDYFKKRILLHAARA
jgi:hypothetical protein